MPQHKTTSPIPPQTVPITRTEKIAWLQLTRSRRVGPTTFLRLIRQFGTITSAIEALPDIAADAGETTYAPSTQAQAAAELSRGEAIGARLLCLGEEEYPHALYDLIDPPPVLWAMGDMALLRRPVVALVGARNASALGCRMARRLAQELGAAGYVVASGLARGIDAAAHEAALRTGTISVQAGGIDIVYPRETADLMHDIGTEGLRLSEMPIGLAPQARHFPRRNRIISGIARGIVVVEGAAKSGSMITARAALDQGREVLAVPGHPMDARASGCNILIRDGATLVRGAEDVMLALRDGFGTEPELPLEIVDPSPTNPAPISPAPSSPASDLSRRILSLLSTTAVAEDTILREVAAPAPHVMATLAELDLEGAIIRQPGGLISRAA